MQLKNIIVALTATTLVSAKSNDSNGTSSGSGAAAILYGNAGLVGAAAAGVVAVLL